MRYLLVFLVLAGFLISSITYVDVAYGMWFPQSPEELFEQSETVFVGTITSVNVLEFERSNTYNVEENGIPRIEIENYTQILDEYTVNIEEFLKNPQESKTITMLEATVSGVPGRSVSIGGFELGDRVLFYVPKIDGTNQYSPESFKIPKQCDSKIVLIQPRIEGSNSFEMLQNGVIKRDNFTAGIPIDFVYKRDLGSLDGKSFDFQITIRTETDPGKFDELVLSEKINAKSNTCEWIATAKVEFVPQMGNYRTWVHTTEDTSGSSFGGSFSVNDYVEYGEIIPPLKQFQSGMVFDDIECRDSLVLIQKHDGTPACVTESAKQKLIERGWTITQSKNLATSADSKKLLSLLEAGQVEEFNKLKASLIISSNPFLSLNGTNLQGLDLSGIDLTGVHVAGTDMQNANLQGMILNYKNIKDANLQGADLIGVDLSDAYMNNVNLQNANLQNANLKNIHLGSSDLDYADLMGADLRGVNFQFASMVDTNFEGANMQGTDLSETNLDNLNFQGAHLQFAHLKHATLSNANLKNTNLSNANLENANLRGADLSGADLNGAILKNADLLDANFTDTKNLSISTEEARQRGAIIN